MLRVNALISRAVAAVAAATAAVAAAAAVRCCCSSCRTVGRISSWGVADFDHLLAQLTGAVGVLPDFAEVIHGRTVLRIHKYSNKLTNIIFSYKSRELNLDF